VDITVCAPPCRMRAGGQANTGGCPLHVVSVSTTGMQAVGAAPPVPGSAALGGCKTRSAYQRYASMQPQLLPKILARSNQAKQA